MTELRPYQTAIVDGCRDAFRAGKRTALVQLPTGGGKTVLGSFMVNGSARRGLVCWWLVHRRELLTQASRTFYDLDIPHGLVLGGRSTDPTHNVQIGSIQTVARRLDQLSPPDLIVFDETHHLGAAQWQSVYDAFPKARVVGLTATPWRLDGTGLGHWFETMVEGPSVAQLIEDGSLSPYRLFAPSMIDLAGVTTAMGDYKVRDLAKVMDKPSITGDAVQHYSTLCPGKRAVAFGVSIEHSRHIAAQFIAAGIPAEHVDGETDTATRDAAVARFVRGETLILSNADLFGEGFDVPAIEAVIDLAPTKSLSRCLQKWGRSFRPVPGKTAIILDHASNSLRHGLPDDERQWTLDDRPKRSKAAPSENPVWQCIHCFRVYRPAPKCPGCGFVTTPTPREIEQRAGVLAEVDRSIIQRQRKAAEADCVTMDDWVQLGIARGYANPSGWAFHRFNARQRRAA